MGCSPLYNGEILYNYTASWMVSSRSRFNRDTYYRWFFIAIVGFPFILLLCRNATRRIEVELDLLEWNKDKLTKSVIITFILGFFAVVSIQSIYYSSTLFAEIKNSSFPEYKFTAILRIVFSLGWIMFWLLIHSCFMHPYIHPIKMQNKAQ